MRRRLKPQDSALAVRFDRESNEFDRSLGFFDATYAFALTLLVVNIDVPAAEKWSDPLTLLASVSSQGTGFVLSFVVIVVFWLSNQAIISRLKVLDRTSIVLNIVVIGFVIFIPFSTQAISDPGLEQLSLPTVLYALNCAAVLAVQTIMYETAMSRGFGKVTRSPRTVLWERIDSLANPGVFLLSIPVALLVGGVAGKITWLLMIPVGVVTGRQASRAELDDLQAMQQPDAAASDQTG